MARRDDFEDDDDRDIREPVPFPAGVRVAGVLWIVFGSLALVGYAISLAMNMGGRAAQGGGGQPGANVGGVWCGALFALAFLVVGVQTVKGTAKSTLGNGIGSLVFGLLYAFGAVFLAVAAASRQAVPGSEPLLFGVAALVALFAAMLLTAGILALLGKRAYEDWRAAGEDSGGARLPRFDRRHERDDEPRRREREDRRDRDDADDRSEPGDDRFRT